MCQIERTEVRIKIDVNQEMVDGEEMKVGELRRVTWQRGKVEFIFVGEQ